MREFYQFGQFRLAPAEHILTRDGETVAVTPKTFELLTYLVLNRGRLISKEELLRAIWPDSFVEEANLTVTMSTLRRALGEKRGETQFIDTVPKKGYRFIATVTESNTPERVSLRSTEAAASGSAYEEPGTLSAPSAVETIGRDVRLSDGKGWFWAVLVLILLSVGVLALRPWYWSRQSSSTPNPGKRVAVLPFQNLRRDPADDFLGFSLADSIINKLGYVSALTIRPSYAVQKYRGEMPDLEQVARALSVDTLLTGNFLREGEMLRVSYQLVDAKSDRILRKGTIDVKYQNLMIVQDQVAGQVVTGLELTLSPSEARRLQDQTPVDPRAYEYYLRGVDYYARNDFLMAVKFLEKSAELSPEYPLTWAHLGRSYTALASFKFGGAEQYRKAENAYQRALALDRDNLQARIFMANFLSDTGRVEQAVPMLRETLQSNPNLAEAHWELGYAYRFGGLLEESIRECLLARRQDPGVKLTSSVMNAYLYLGEYDMFSQSLPSYNDFALIEFYRGFVSYHQRDWEAAMAGFDRAFELDSELLQAQVGKALSLGLRHDTTKAITLLRSAENKINQRGVGDPEAIYKIAQAYAELGDKESALRMFRLSVEKGFFPHPYFSRDPLMASLRDLPEYQSIMQAALVRHEAFRARFGESH